MDSICSVFGCPNSQAAINDPSVYFYKFPKHGPTLNQWINLAGCSADVDVNLARICSIHFDDSCFRNEFKKLDNNVTCCTRILKFDAIPSLHLPTTELLVQDEDLNEIILLQNEDSDEIFVLSVAQSESQHNQTLEIPVRNITRQDFDELFKTNAQVEQNLNRLKSEVQNLEKQLEEKKQSLKENEVILVQAMKASNASVANMKSRIAKPKNTLLSKVFSKTQIQALLGKKISWSEDDLAVACTIRNLTNKQFYTYLTKTLKYPLPASSTYKRWIKETKPLNEQTSEENEKS